MSIKAQQFARIITNPMNLHKFEVSIPGIEYSTIVESSTFPSQGPHREIVLWAQGEKVSYYGLPENGGEWSITIPESDSGAIKEAFDAKFASQYDQKTGLVTPRVWDDILVVCKDLADQSVFSVTLHGCWIMRRGDLNLNASSPEAAAKWDYTFKYNWLEDNKITGKGSIAQM